MATNFFAAPATPNPLPTFTYNPANGTITTAAGPAPTTYSLVPTTNTFTVPPNTFTIPSPTPGTTYSLVPPNTPQTTPPTTFTLPSPNPGTTYSLVANPSLTPSVSPTIREEVVIRSSPMVREKVVRESGNYWLIYQPADPNVARSKMLYLGPLTGSEVKRMEEFVNAVNARLRQLIEGLAEKEAYALSSLTREGGRGLVTGLIYLADESEEILDDIIEPAWSRRSVERYILAPFYLPGEESLGYARIPELIKPYLYL